MGWRLCYAVVTMLGENLRNRPCPGALSITQNISVACVVAHLLQLVPVCLCILRQNRQGLRDAELVRTGCSLWALHGVAPLSKLMLYVLA